MAIGVGNDGAAGESSFKSSGTEWFVTRSGRVNGSSTVKHPKLRFGLRSLQGDGELISGYLYVGADGHARSIGRIVGTDDANREWVLVMREEGNLLAWIPEPANREN